MPALSHLLQNNFLVTQPFKCYLLVQIALLPKLIILFW